MTHFQEEIYEQPAVLAGILADTVLKDAAAVLQKRDPSLILTLARGSSDNAVTFFSYLAGQYLGLPVASLPPSLFTVYKSKLKPEDALAIGVSQSGESSDVVESLKALSGAGAITLSVSNVSGSSLESFADFVINQGAGQEQAVAASKTFSSQMMVLACLVAHWSGEVGLKDALEHVPEQLSRLLENTDEIERVALRLTHAESAYVLGRGLSYACSLELALKLKETAYLHAQAYSSAEFQHGPIASVDRSDPILLLGTDDETLQSNKDVAERLRDVGADLTVLSSQQELLGLSSAKVSLPQNLHPVTEAFLQVVAGQLLALHLALSKGINPDAPRHLKKVTKTL